MAGGVISGVSAGVRRALPDVRWGRVKRPAVKRLNVTKLPGPARLLKQNPTFCVASEFASRDDGFVPMRVLEAGYGRNRLSYLRFRAP
jgi:hypothetical protein